MPSLLITATDTGVGKTLITAALARTWRDVGRDVGVMKPLCSGCELGPDGKPFARDTAILTAAAGVDDPDELVTVQTFEAPLAPNVAARLEERPVDMRGTVRALAELQRRHEWLLVEGLGGALAPMTDEISVADWAAAAHLPALIVARTDLGTLNHTLMTVECLRARDIPVVGIVLNRLHGGDAGIAEQTNPDTLRRLVDVPVWGPVPFLEGVGGEVAVDDVVKRLPELPFAEEIADLIQRR